MDPSLERLTKILRLESQQGYKNNAVIGGLEKMLPFWEPEARRSLDGELVEQIVAFIRGYVALPAESRPQAIRDMLTTLAGAAEESPPTVERRPASQSRQQAVGRRPPDEARPPTSERKPRGETQPPTANRLPLAPESPAAKVEAVPIAAPPGPEPPAALAEAPISTLPSPTPSPASRPTPSAPRSSPHTPRPSPMPSATPAALDAPLTVLPGIGSKIAKTLEKLGLYTLGDMLTFFPRRYDDYSQLKPINRLVYGEEVTIIGTIWETRLQKTRGGQGVLVKTIVSDSTGTIECTWFNQPWLAEKFRAGRQIVLSGKIDQYLGRLVMQSPSWEPLDRHLLHTGRIVPVYPLTEGISARWLRERMNLVVTQWAPRVPDPLPEAVRERAGLMDYPAALQQIHFPDSHAALAAARQRLAFDELLRLQLRALRHRREWQSAPGHPLTVSDAWLDARLAALPFALTGAQTRALADLRADLARETPMTRLLQGDVGSGKTVIAALASAIAAANGAQAAIMAPTGILAEQHYHNFTRLLPEEAPRTALLLGATPDSEKRAIYERLHTGEIAIVIGTHALIEGAVEFANLALAVVDEQHRFGVSQRAALRAKGRGYSPHLLVMSATPIPRSLALTLYGDLDLSVLDEMPPGRRPIETRLIYQNERERAYAFVRSQIQQGRQAFIICPLVEESDKIESRAAIEEHARLQQHVFPDLKLGLLHGRMKPDEKEAVMNAFRRGETHILVSTSVVEVGVDVPNATVMLIEGANRFGLAQLHQFRGRVGRGEHPSYCLLVSDAPAPRLDNGDERLKAMESSSDGFALAEKDLAMRGPGEFLGTRQAGYGDLRLAKISDLRLIELARREAQRLFADDPALEKPEHRLLAEALATPAASGAGDVS